MCQIAVGWNQLGIRREYREDGTMDRAEERQVYLQVESTGLSLALLGFLAASQSWIAQSSNGQITGLITDSSGAAVEDASISATNTATGVTYDSTTNGSGVYVLLAARPRTLQGLVDQGRICHRRTHRADCAHRRPSFGGFQHQAGHHERDRDGHRVSAVAAVGPVERVRRFSTTR